MHVYHNSLSKSLISVLKYLGLNKMYTILQTFSNAYALKNIHLSWGSNWNQVLTGLVLNRREAIISTNNDPDLHH